MKSLTLVLALLLSTASLPSFAQDAGDNSRAAARSVQVQQSTRGSQTAADDDGDMAGFIELLRSDIRAEKVALLTEDMGLTRAEAEAFWPLQRAYENELAPISDRRVQLIRSYAEQWGALDDAAADEIVSEWFAIHQDRLALQKSTYRKMKKAVGALVAARFLQIESAVGNLIDLQIAAELPILE